MILVGVQIRILVKTWIVKGHEISWDSTEYGEFFCSCWDVGLAYSIRTFLEYHSVWSFGSSESPNSHTQDFVLCSLTYSYIAT